MGLFDIFKKNVNPPQAKSNDIQTPAVKVTVSVSTPKPPTQAEIDAEVVPVEAHIKDAIPSKQGLFPHEILVLDYAHTFYTDENSFQGFWWYRYGVRDVQVVLTSLVKRGFLQIGDIRSTLEKQNATVIKEVLKTHELKLSGEKAELVQRLLDSIPESELNERFPKRTYALTDLGEAALDEEVYVSYIHRHGVEDLDIWSLNKMVHTQPYMPYRDKLWGYLNQRSMQHFQDRNFGLYRNCRFNMSQFLCEEKKYRDALAMLAEVVFFDLSGANNNYDPQFLEIYAPFLFPYKESLATMAPGIISIIVSYQKELGYSDDEIRVALMERMAKLSAPLQLFTVEECVQIVFLERDHDTEALTKMYAKAKREFKQKYPNIKLEKTF